MYKVYDGFVVDENATKDDTLNAIYDEFFKNADGAIPNAASCRSAIFAMLEEAFSCGFKRGECYGVEIGRLNERDNPIYKEEY
jgi:hypothetical protein